MNKLLFMSVVASSATFFIFSLFCSNSIDFNEIDAVSNATEDIKVDSGRAYADRAVLHTYHEDSYNLHFMAYGLLNDITDTIIVADTPRNHAVLIPGLEPGTTYSFNYVGLYVDPVKGPVWHENHMAVGNFTTISRINGNITK